jgi:hypothetical protein
VSQDTVQEVEVSADETMLDAYQALKSFKFHGHQFRKGDAISLAVYRHKRFETLVSTGYVKAVKP